MHGIETELKWRWIKKNEFGRKFSSIWSTWFGRYQLAEGRIHRNTRPFPGCCGNCGGTTGTRRSPGDWPIGRFRWGYRRPSGRSWRSPTDRNVPRARVTSAVNNSFSIRWDFRFDSIHPNSNGLRWIERESITLILSTDRLTQLKQTALNEIKIDRVKPDWIG